ncbi:MAG TPA: GNAT family N-acetyltransferase [Gemmatimonadales bacterium]|nr:GNAT family N-acetyltransferase [Gemmatimonadales bacterium]
MRILQITRATGVFREEELAIAEEVFRDCVGAPGPSGGGVPESEPRAYYALGAEVGGELAGWICWGATPCTEGTWDLYWLAVDPGSYRTGVATALVAEMERRLVGKARLVSIDTSGRPDYEPTRRFYEARGYIAVARVPDFYAPGDDQVIFTKQLR